MTYGEELLNRLKNNKKKDANKIILEQTKGTYMGTAIGAGIGLAIGYSRKYNLLVSALIGGLIGGLISRYTIPKE